MDSSCLETLQGEEIIRQKGYVPNCEATARYLFNTLQYDKLASPRNYRLLKMEKLLLIKLVKYGI